MRLGPVWPRVVPCRGRTADDRNGTGDRTMRTLAFMLALALAGASTGAEARCAYGQKNLAGSLGPGGFDGSRSFTLRGAAQFMVQVTRGGPISANLGCGWRTGRFHACAVYGNGERWVQLENPTGRQITYRWICRH